MNLIYGQGRVAEVETKESRNGLLIGNIKLKTEDSQFFLTAFGDTAQVVAALQGGHVAFQGTLNARTYTTRDGTDTWAMSPTVRELTVDGLWVRRRLRCSRGRTPRSTRARSCITTSPAKAKPLVKV